MKYLKILETFPCISIQGFKKRTENFFSSKDPEENLKNLKGMDQLFDEALAYAKKKREEEKCFTCSQC